MDRDVHAKAQLDAAAARALELMRLEGFDDAQVGSTWTLQEELNIAHSRASLLRSTDGRKLSLTGLVDGRKASTELDDFSRDALPGKIAELFATASGAPQDAANALSAGQCAQIIQGPQAADVGLLSEKALELLAFREREAPRMGIDEGSVAHTLAVGRTLTTGGTDISTSVGWYSLAALGVAREGPRTSSFNFALGQCHDLATSRAPDLFGLGAMLRDTARQIDPQPFASKFVGDVVLSPKAVGDLVTWLLAQLSDVQLISGTSLYADRVGERIASPLLTLGSRAGAPGVTPVSADGFVVHPVRLLDDGFLRTATPSLYGSRSTGLAHVPVAAGGWEIQAGASALAQMLAGVRQGALVGRLSMGLPAPNGDFSGVIKNSFRVQDGVVGPALSEAMISGNLASILRDVVSVSRERIDTGATCLPWLGASDIQFS